MLIMSVFDVSLLHFHPEVQSERPADLPVHIAADQGDLNTVLEIVDKDPSMMYKMGVWRLPMNRAIASDRIKVWWN